MTAAHAYRAAQGAENVEIRVLELLEGAKKAQGLTVIIDVFRAFTTECYAFSEGARWSWPIARLEDAFALKKRYPDAVLLGERGGAKVDGCDLGNSPYDVTKTFFRGKAMIHSTSAGTQGIAAAAQAGAEEIVTGSLVNAKAVAAYIRFRKPSVVSIVAMGKAGLTSTNEDLICARYIEALLRGKVYDIDGKIAWLRYHGAEQFFDPVQADIFPREDYPLCVAHDRFDFVLRVCRDEEGRLMIRRADPPEWIET